MSEEKNSTTSSVFSLISKIQRCVLYFTLFFIPWFIIPLPFDSTERIKSIVFIFLACLIILLEVIKWIWDGKISVIKSSLDKVFLLLFLSFLVSTIFARDPWMSFWGYDGRLGTGFFVMLFLFLFLYLSRGFLQKRQHIVNSVVALSVGLLTMIVLSMLSVFKVDIFGWIPYISDFFVVGLPLTFSFQEAMLLAGASIFFGLFLIVSFIEDKKYQGLIYPLIAVLVSFVSLTAFSINQGALVPVIFFVVSIPVCILLWFKLSKSLKAIPIVIFIFSLLSLGLSIGFQYPSFIKSVLGESFSTINPLRLGADISWVVASSSIVNDFLRGLIGLGNDSFGIAYNLFKPNTDTTLALGNTTFVSGSSEFFTILGNRGLIGVTVWIILGIAYLKLIIKQITTLKGERGTLSFMLGLVALFLFVGSMFVPFSFLTYFLLFVSTVLLIVFDNREDSNEEFLVKFWAVNIGKVTKDINKTVEGINWFLTIAITLITTAGIIFLFVKTASTAYVVRAEAYNIEMNVKYQDAEEVSFEVREEYLERMAGYYDRALRYDSKDPYVNRKSSLISLEIIKLLAEKYTDVSEEEKEGLISSITTWKNASIDLSRKALDTSPLTYANWNTRANVYIGLVSVGLTDYTEDALSALQSCINLNPLDYDAYYKAGQIYMVKEDYDKALSAFNTVLSIKGNDIASLMLSASILNQNGDTENALAYLKAAKEILDVNKQDSGELYTSIVNSIQALEGGMGTENVQVETEGIDEIEGEETDEVLPNPDAQ